MQPSCSLVVLLLALLCGPTSASLLGDWRQSAVDGMPGRLPTSADWHQWAMTEPAAPSGEDSVQNISWPTGMSHSGRKQGWLRTSVAQTAAVLGDPGESEVKVGEYVYGTLNGYGTYSYFTYKPTSLNVPWDIFVGMGSCADIFCYIIVYMSGNAFPVSSNSSHSWWYDSAIRINSAHPLSCEYRNIPLADCEYHYSLMSYYGEQPYFTTIAVPPSDIAELSTGISWRGTLDEGASAYFFIANGALNDIMILALTVTDGDCDLYVSTTIERPGPTNYTWSSRDDGDDLVIINGTRTGPGGRPGLYYFVGVHSRPSSSSSYSIVGSGYSIGNPLANAWYIYADTPQRDYAMANTYRYYYVWVDGMWPQMTITLDSLRGDADMSAWHSHIVPEMHNSKAIVHSLDGPPRVCVCVRLCASVCV